MTLHKALTNHWPEYLIEAGGLGMFMISAGAFGSLLESPASPVHHAISDPIVRRALMGIAMGLTAIAIIYSPWGRQSGAHINPAVTFTFWWLGKIATLDAACYVAAQFAGGLAGVWLVAFVIGDPFTRPPVTWVVTTPGGHGAWIAFVAETLIAAVLMFTVLCLSNSRTLNQYTGVAAGILVAIYITVEAPLSGMSMNPARSLASGLPSGELRAWWVYVTAPIIGMVTAAAVYRRLWPDCPPACAKLDHHTRRRCIFDCHFGELTANAGGGVHACECK